MTLVFGSPQANAILEQDRSFFMSGTTAEQRISQLKSAIEELEGEIADLESDLAENRSELRRLITLRAQITPETVSC